MAAHLPPGCEPLSVFMQRDGVSLSRSVEIQEIIEVIHNQQPVSIPDPNPHFTEVLTDVGEKLLRGIISCVVKAHRVRRTYNGALGVDHLWVNPETISVGVIHGLVAADGWLTEGSQEADYSQLSVVIDQVFQPTVAGRPYPSHVASICTILVENMRTGDNGSEELEGRVLVERRTQVLHALAAMTDPLVMAAMWWNLLRFKKSLRHLQQRWQFADAARRAYPQGNLWWGFVGAHPNFAQVFNHNNGQAYVQDHEDGWCLLRFARNWFTHVPNQRLAPPAETPQAQVRDLDYIFSYYFNTFMRDLLVQLYPIFDLSGFLVPLS